MDTRSMCVYNCVYFDLCVFYAIEEVLMCKEMILLKDTPFGPAPVGPMVHGITRHGSMLTSS